jgi:ribonuclease P protein component
LIFNSPVLGLFLLIIMARQFTLGKNERLKSRKAIEQLFSEGKKFSISPFRLFYTYSNPASSIQHPSSGIRFGIGVSSRNFKKAVDRNRIKRLVREAWRLQKNPLQEQLKEKGLVLNVFFIYTGAELPEYLLVADKVQAVIKKLQKLIHENISPNT